MDGPHSGPSRARVSLGSLIQGFPWHRPSWRLTQLEAHPGRRHFNTLPPHGSMCTLYSSLSDIAFCYWQQMLMASLLIEAVHQCDTQRPVFSICSKMTSQHDGSPIRYFCYQLQKKKKSCIVGSVVIIVFGAWSISGTKSQDISASAVWYFLVNVSFVSSFAYRRTALNCEVCFFN